MSDFRSYRPDGLPPVVKNLLLLNGLVFVAMIVFNGNNGSGPDLTEKLPMYPIMPEALRSILEQANPRYADGQQFYPYQIATHMFAHGGILHLLFNMLGLWMFGKVLEGLWGPKRFLLFYLACGVGAAVCHLIIQYIRCELLLDAVLANDEMRISRLIGAAAPVLGASGAIMGIFAAYAYLFPNTELYIMGAIPVKAKWAVLGMAAYDIFGGVSNSGDNIAHFAHLGGALTGFIFVLIWNKTARNRFY